MPGLSNLPWSVRVTRRSDGYELSVPELLIVLRARDLAAAHQLLTQRLRDLLEQALLVGERHELPPGRPPPVLASAFPGGAIDTDVSPVERV